VRARLLAAPGQCQREGAQHEPAQAEQLHRRHLPELAALLLPGDCRRRADLRRGQAELHAMHGGQADGDLHHGTRRGQLRGQRHVQRPVPLREPVGGVVEQQPPRRFGDVAPGHHEHRAADGACDVQRLRQRIAFGHAVLHAVPAHLQRVAAAALQCRLARGVVGQDDRPPVRTVGRRQLPLRRRQRQDGRLRQVAAELQFPARPSGAIASTACT
jgi:hypothetical protein